jgi:hypothetical protein
VLVGRDIENEVNRILIISPHEANQLYKRMSSSIKTSLHLYKPRCNYGYKPLDKLDLHTRFGSSSILTDGIQIIRKPKTQHQLQSDVLSAEKVYLSIPQALVVQLNLFGGQLYLSSYEDYKETSKFLGLSVVALTGAAADQGIKLAADGFILDDGRGEVGSQSGLKSSPTNFFKILLSKVRRNGDSIAKTHMGSLLEGKLFEEADFKNQAG